MSRRIFKYQLSKVDVQEIELPHGYDLLTCEMQAGVPTIWAIVNDLNDNARYRVWIVPTGDILPTDEAAGQLSSEHFIGTVRERMLDTELVWHLFMRSV